MDLSFNVFLVLVINHTGSYMLGKHSPSKLSIPNPNILFLKYEWKPCFCNGYYKHIDHVKSKKKKVKGRHLGFRGF